MKDLNRVTLTGHVGADPEVRHADNGTVVTKFTVASNRRWTDAQGAAQEETEWFNIVCFSRLAEIAGDYLNKGSTRPRRRARPHPRLRGRQRAKTLLDRGDRR